MQADNILIAAAVFRHLLFLDTLLDGTDLIPQACGLFKAQSHGSSLHPLAQPFDHLGFPSFKELDHPFHQFVVLLWADQPVARRTALADLVKQTGPAALATTFQRTVPQRENPVNLLQGLADGAG